MKRPVHGLQKDEWILVISKQLKNYKHQTKVSVKLANQRKMEEDSQKYMNEVVRADATRQKEQIDVDLVRDEDDD